MRFNQFTLQPSQIRSAQVGSRLALLLLVAGAHLSIGIALLLGAFSPALRHEDPVMMSVNLLQETARAEPPQVAKTSQPTPTTPTTPPPATLKSTQNIPPAAKPVSVERPSDVAQHATAAPSPSSTAQETLGSTAQSAPTRETAASATPAPALRSGVSIDAAYAAGNPKPPYPPMARRLGEEGTVTLRILVSSDGQATKVEVKRSSGSSLLDKSAQQTIKQWRFIPAKLDGKPIEEWYETSWLFKLEG